MQRLRTISAVFGAAFRNRTLLRLELAWAGFNGAEWGVWVALLVYAYTHGGPVAASAIALVQLVPAAVLAPFLGALTDRRRPGRVLLAAYIVMAVAMAAIAGAMALDAPRWVIFALSPVVNLAITVPRPAQSALLPGVVRSANELTAANVVGGWMDGLSVLIAPALTGVLLGVGGPQLAIGILALLALIAAILVSTTPGTQPIADLEVEGGLVHQVASGVGIVWRDRPVRTLTGLLGAQYVLVGSLDMLYVVLAITVLGMGESGAGYLNSAFGAGSLIGAALAATLVARRRLAPTLVMGIVLASVALAVLGVHPSVVAAFVLLALAGVGRMTFDVTGRILLQRATPPGILAQVFALLESLMNVGLAIGSLFVPILVEVSGARAALIGVAALFLLIIAVTARRLWAIDAAADVPQVEIRLLKSISIFAPLPAPQLEGLARALRPVSADAGTVVIHEGDAGDCYYAIADGEVAVSQDGHEVNRLGRGGGVGEIALIRDVPRTATVTALTHTELYALDKEPFLLAVTGHATAARACNDLVAQLLGGSKRAEPSSTVEGPAL